MFFVLFCVFEAFSKSCSNYDAQLNEKFILDTTEIFNDNYDYSNYLLTDQDNKLQLQKPICSLESRIIDDSLQQPQVLKLSTIQADIIGWTNYFALFRIAQNNYEILYTAAYSLGGQDRLPKFDSMVVLDSIENIKCHDFVIYQKNQFVVDCYELKIENPEHFFYYITINADTQEIVKTKINNHYPYTSDYSRQLLISSTAADKYYLYRITSNKLSFDNSVEIFTLNLQDNQITLFTQINKQFFIDQNLTKDYPSYESFIILNVKSDYFSLTIALTDAFGNLLIFTYSKDAWQFKIVYHEQGIVLDTFDFKFDSRDFVAQAKNKLIISNQNQIYIIDFKYDISSYTPQFTKSFIILKSENNLVLIYSTIILYTLPGQFSVDLFDYFQDDFLIVENNKIDRYYVENSFKIIFHPNDQSDQKTHQAQISYKDCNVKLEYQAIQSTFTELIQVRQSNHIFAEEGFISLPIIQWTVFNEYVYGPLKQKSFLNANLTKNEELIFQQDSEVDLSTFSDTENVQFLKVTYQQNSQTSFVLLASYPPNILILKVCSVTHYLECKKKFSYTIDLVFTNKNIQLEYIDSKFTMFILRGNNQIWTIEIDVNTGYQNQKLYSLSLEMETIGLTKEYIIFWSSQQSLILIISRDTLNENYRIKTNPQQIFCKQNTNTIYIYSKEKNILYLITLLPTSVITQYKINFSQETADIKILFHNFTFSLIQKFTDGKINAQIWSNELETNIYLLKQIPLYGYEIYDLKDVTCSYTDHILYIKTKSKLLIYFVDQPNHNSLHNVLEIKEKLMFNQGVFGLLFGVVEEKLTLYSVNYLNYAKYQFGLEQQDYVEKKDYYISYSNEQSRINLQQNLRIFNSNTKISLKPENLQIQTNLTQSNQKNYTQDMGTDWYQGLIINIKSVGNNGVKILQQINLEQQEFIQNVNDIEDFNDETLLVVYFNYYSFVSKKDGHIIKQYQFQNSFQCYEILHIQQKQSAIVNCIKGAQIYLVSIVCQGLECQSSQGLPLLSNIVKAFIFGNQMFLLYQNQLIAYIINEDLLQIDKAQSQGQLQISFNSQGNEMNKVRDNHYHRYYLDKLGNFLIDEIKISDNKVQKFNTNTFNLFNFLNNDYQMNSKSSMRKILILSSNYEETDLYTGSHYGLQFIFQCKTDTCQISQQKFNYILQGYPTFNLLYTFELKIPTKNNYLIIPYQEEQNNKNFIAVYKLDIPKQQNIPILFNGIVRFTNMYPVNLIMKSAIYENQIYLLLNILKYQTLIKFSINDSPKIVFDGKFNSTNNVTIQVQNDFESTTFAVSITVTEEDSENNGSLVWLWVTLGIVGGGAFIGAGFYFYRKKKSSVQDQLIA